MLLDLGLDRISTVYIDILDETIPIKLIKSDVALHNPCILQSHISSRHFLAQHSPTH